jgi:hypothetical protein
MVSGGLGYSAFQSQYVGELIDFHRRSEFLFEASLD